MYSLSVASLAAWMVSSEFLGSVGIREPFYMAVVAQTGVLKLRKLLEESEHIYFTLAAMHWDAKTRKAYAS